MRQELLSLPTGETVVFYDVEALMLDGTKSALRPRVYKIP